VRLLRRARQRHPGQAQRYCQGGVCAALRHIRTDWIVRQIIGARSEQDVEVHITHQDIDKPGRAVRIR
jgi:hypothetical protein